MEKTLVLQAYTFEEHFDEGADFVVVTISPQFARQLLVWMDAVVDLNKKDARVFRLECWDASPAWYEWDGQVEEMLDGSDSIALTELLGLDVDGFRRVCDDCTVVAVHENGILWKSTVKYTDVLIETCEIERALLEEIVQEGDS